MSVGIFLLFVLDLDQRTLSRIEQRSGDLVTESLQKEWEERILDLTRLLANHFSQFLYRMEVSQMSDLAFLAQEGEGILYVYVHDREGRILVDVTEGSPLLGEEPRSDMAKRSVEAAGEILQRKGIVTETAAPVYFGTERIGTVRVGFSTEGILHASSNVRGAIRAEVNTAVEGVARATVLLAVAVILAAVGLGIFFSRMITAPLKHLIAGTSKVAAGDLDSRIEVDSRDELGRLATAFNEMAENLQRITVSKDYVDNVLRNMLSGLIVAGPEGRISTANQAALELTGFSEEEVVGMELDTLFAAAGPGVSEDVSGELLRQGQLSQKEKIIRTRDGSEVPVLFSGSVMRDGKGRLMGFVAAALDITERKEAEEAINEYARKMERSNRLQQLFTDILSHDLMNPASIITHMTSLLAAKDHPRDEEEVSMILRNSRKMLELIQDASQYARVESSESLVKEEIDLNSMLSGIVERLRPQFDEKRVSVNLIPIDGDATMTASPIVEGIFSNLISNAAKYSPPARSVTVSIDDEGEHWKVSVADQGDGVPDTFKTSIFERFVRREKRGVVGTGLGLAIARRIVNLHHGEIRVEDRSGGGSVFVVTLPKGVGGDSRHGSGNP